MQQKKNWEFERFVYGYQYKTEKDGVVETRVEQRITISNEGGDPIDHDEVNKHSTYSSSVLISSASHFSFVFLFFFMKDSVCT